MKSLMTVLALMLSFASFTATAAEEKRAFSLMPGAAHSEALQRVLEWAVDVALRRFASQQLRADQIAVTLVELTRPEALTSASHRGAELVYPASVVKLFYLFAAHQWLEEGRLRETAELRRALRDMIVHSYNEPTHYIVDLLTDTTSGPELSEPELEIWHDRRNAVNRYFTSLGYHDLNVNKKPWCEGPYGRETQAIQRFTPNRNWLTTDATARLMSEIFLDRNLPRERCAAMRELLRREPRAAGGDDDPQAQFTGPALPEGARLWSKAGWTSETRHDAACIELPNGRKIVLVVFTVDHAGEPELISTIARAVLENLP